MAVNPSDIVKTAFVTINGTYAFRRMPFGSLGAAPNFQKAIEIILKPVIGKFVSVYMDDVIISSPSSTQHVKHLKEVFRLLQEAGLTLNKDKCKFGCEELKYLGLIINKEGIKTDEAKVQAIVEMKHPHNSKEVSKFLGMSQCSYVDPTPLAHANTSRNVLPRGGTSHINPANIMGLRNLYERAETQIRSLEDSEVKGENPTQTY
ncbi:retrovirus-related Pol polyprotein from transposon opus [Trichonephila clavipes]|nr:retrovirus-related Pol polyprotein from transposon opus [Trichonephila clavipes]